MNKIIVYIFLLITVLTCFCACGRSGREYKGYITFQLQDTDDVLIIKEWTYLLSSGADIYYKHGDDAPVFLGKTSGGDNGFCPFSEGMYEITEDGDAVKISWCFKPSDSDRANWRSEYFQLPIK